jgi:hypothetical protein
MPVIQPDLETFVSERLLDGNVGCPVPVDVYGRYCQRGFIRFESELSIPAAREMKLYCPEVALGETMAGKDGAIGLVITVEIGSGERLPERRPEIRWR